jgi:hypothetical protein
MRAIVEPELSRITQLSDVPDEGITLHVEAGAEEREALAGRFGAIAIESLTAEVSLHPKHKRTCWQLDGHVLAEVVQSCVVTLSPVLVNSRFGFKREYAAGPGGEGMIESHGGDEVLNPDQDDPPEPLPDDVIDVGEAIAEEFGLALDPFPRAAGVTFDGYSVGPTAQESTVNAFAILAERHSNENEKKG